MIVLGLPVTIGLGSIILTTLYGGEYTFNLKLALLFGIAGICMCIDKLYGTLMTSVGVKGIRITSFAAILLAVTNISLNIWLIPLIGIEGAIIATILSYMVSIGIIISKRSYFYNPEAIKC